MEVTDAETKASDGTAVAVPESGDGMPDEQVATEPTDAEGAASQKSDSDMHKIRCPVCGDTFTPQGMSGHLRFGHHKTGEEFDELMEKARSGERIELEEPKQKSSEAPEEKGSDGEGQEIQGVPDSQGREGPKPQDEGVTDSFSWEDRLERMESIRGGLDRLDRSRSFGPFEIDRDEGCREAMEALDEIEMEVRERLGTSETDEELRNRVDESLDRMASLIRCREQREAIDQRFSGDKAQRRINRLDQKEAEIRAHVREEWDVGKPTEDLNSNDPVAELESEETGEGSGESTSDSSGGVISRNNPL